jgi:hypothetical protein
MSRLARSECSFTEVGVPPVDSVDGDPLDGDGITSVIVMGGKPGVAALAAVDRRLCRCCSSAYSWLRISSGTALWLSKT